ncbi:MAG: hypothetical protein V4757_23600 [Pseudomonadota bacterium]
MKSHPEPAMPFLPATASFPQSPRASGSVRAGTSPGAAAAAAPGWARPQVSWPFLAAAPLAARTSAPAPASFSA